MDQTKISYLKILGKVSENKEVIKTLKKEIVKLNQQLVR